MPGRLFLQRTGVELARDLDVDAPDFYVDPRRNIAPGQEIVVLTAQGLTQMRWGMIPVGRTNARGRPVMETIINARGETLFDKSAFHGTGRALIVCDGWYEWTGEKRKKQPWRIWPIDEGLLAFAAITDVWNAPGGIQIHQVAAVTCEPSDDVKHLHHRMGVVVPPMSRQTWLSGTEAEAHALIKPAPAGTLQHECADDVDWNAA